MSESAVSAKRVWVYVWRETGAVRNARPSRGQAASTRTEAKWDKIAKLPSYSERCVERGQRFGCTCWPS